MRCFLFVPNLARLSQLCRECPRSCSCYVPAGSAVFAFLQESTCFFFPHPLAHHHWNTRANPDSTTESIRRAACDMFWLLTRESVVVPRNRNSNLKDEIHLLRDCRIRMPPCKLVSRLAYRNLERHGFFVSALVLYHTRTVRRAALPAVSVAPMNALAGATGRCLLHVYTVGVLQLTAQHGV